MSESPPSGADRLIFALDVSSIGEALAWAGQLTGTVLRYKIGLELFTLEGPRALDLLHAFGGRIFLDLKLHDIPETVRRASRAAASTGAELLTVHAAGGRAMLEAAVGGAREGGRTKVLAVTVLTSMELRDLAEIGTDTSSIEALVLKRARVAREAGCDGVIASPQEARAIRQLVGPGFQIITPGVRPAGAAMGDQKRVGSAHQAIIDGADAVVVGRPIRDAKDPVVAARALIDELTAASRAATGES